MQRLKRGVINGAMILRVPVTRAKEKRAEGHRLSRRVTRRASDNVTRHVADVANGRGLATNELVLAGAKLLACDDNASKSCLYVSHPVSVRTLTL